MWIFQKSFQYKHPSLFSSLFIIILNKNLWMEWESFESREGYFNDDTSESSKIVTTWEFLRCLR